MPILHLVSRDTLTPSENKIDPIPKEIISKQENRGVGRAS
jgi:hypothetical protein